MRDAVFQTFHESASPEQGPPRLARLRDEMRAEGLAGFLVPRSDAYQGEYVAPGDERLAWLTGFTGSAGFCVALLEQAGVFVDGRYRTQARAQTALDHFTVVNWPETRPADWIREKLESGGRIGFDPWLYTPDQIAALEAGLDGSQIELVAYDNLVDRCWDDRPAPPVGQVRIYPDHLAGRSHAQKREELAQTLAERGERAAIITLPDSLAWLLNIRGSDIPKNPVPHGFGILHDDGAIQLFMDPAKLGQDVRSHLGNDVTVHPIGDIAQALAKLEGPVRFDRASGPQWIMDRLNDAGTKIVSGEDPCILPKACKNTAEVAATREAHNLDAAALCRFLTWFDQQSPGTITEIDVVCKLEACRRETGHLLDISFDTIAGSGPHGALPHYRVTENSNRILGDGELLVLDGGGQYEKGTTDLTRTLPIGLPGAGEKAAFTRVLQGMIAISRARWPTGLAGRDLDALARFPLWLADLDYDHGTGHGIGVNLCVHEGPQRLSRASHIVLEPGMIVSNEPGYYREGAFGIRIENIVVVQKAEPLPGADDREKLCFETLSYVPIDRRLITLEMLSQAERDWIDTYHAQCHARVAPFVDGEVAEWVAKATLPM
ncbi:MAG: aminopeptidase P family protein [Pseudomonadota bacterium]